MRLLLALLVLLLPVPLQAQWKQAETDRFRVYADMPLRAIEQRARLLEEFHQLLVRATGRDLPEGAPRLDVFLVPDLQPLTQWHPVGANVAGFYRASSGRISAVAKEAAAGSQSADVAQALLLHEYAHHFLLGASRAAYPAWYVEGFADYFSTARFHADRIEYGEANPIRTASLRKDRWIPLEQMLARNPELLRGDQAGIFYAQSWLLTHYLFQTPGMRPRLSAYLRAFGAGEDPVEAFRTHVHPDLRALEGRLRRHAAQQATVSSVERESATPIAVRVTPLSQAAADLLLPTVAVEHGVPQDQRSDALADLRARAQSHADDPVAARALALAELQLGSPARAAAILDQELARFPRDPDLLRWRAQATRILDPGNGVDAARAYLIKALAADPQDWRTLHAYARLYRSQNRAMPQSAMDALMRAYALAPQVNEVVLDTALALSNAGRLSEAAQVLQPLAWAPHGGPASELAQRLLAKARIGDLAGVQQQVAELRRARLPAVTAASAQGL